MKKMRIKNAFFAAIVAVGGLSGLAQAATEGPLTTTTPIPATGTDWSSSLAFPQFNPSLGTLTSVELILNGNFSTTITVTNTNALGSGSSGTAQTEVQLSAQDAGLNLITPELDLVSPTFPYTLAAGGSTTSGLITKSGTDDETYSAAGVLSEFTGLGSYVLPASTFTQTLLANTGGNTTASQVTTAALTGTVTYTYAVPEPGSLSLLGLAGLGVLRRRRRA